MSKQEVLTLNEFLEMSRLNSKPSEYIAKKINNDTKLKGMVIFVAGSLMYCKSFVVNAAPKTVDAISKIDSAGFTMLSLVRTIGYWICIIMCVIEILRALMQGDTKSIGKIIIKYILAFAAFYFLPWLFDIIKGIFG